MQCFSRYTNKRKRQCWHTWTTILLTHLLPAPRFLSTCWLILFPPLLLLSQGLIPTLTSSSLPVSSQSFILYSLRERVPMDWFYSQMPSPKLGRAGGGGGSYGQELGTRSKSPKRVAENQPLEPSYDAFHSPARLSTTSLPPSISDFSSLLLKYIHNASSPGTLTMALSLAAKVPVVCCRTAMFSRWSFKRARI